jgi:hypothetical protein
MLGSHVFLVRIMIPFVVGVITAACWLLAMYICVARLYVEL